MSLDTVIHSGLVLPDKPVHALVLMGGGARTAYQAGVLQGLSAIVGLHPGLTPPFPFQVLVGTSAGALNVAYLASCATQGLAAFDQLAGFWGRLRSDEVYRLRVPPWSRASRWLMALALSRQARQHGAVLDNMPLVDTLHHAISLSGIDESLKSRTLNALAVTASSYTSGVHWTFCHTAHDDSTRAWSRPGRRADFQPITIEHLMASSALPFLFPATPLWVDNRREYFGDGSMRQISPISPALHLGARKVLVIGVGQPQRSGLTSAGPGGRPLQGAGIPTLGSIAGHAMASVFHDTLQADVEQAQRVTQTLRQLPREVAGVLPYQSVDVLAIQPTQSLDALAQSHAKELPPATRHALAGLGALKGGGAALASYLLFEPGFVQALIRLGEKDAFARKAELLAFFGLPAAV